MSNNRSTAWMEQLEGRALLANATPTPDPSAGGIAGIIFDDTNRNGVRDNGEAGSRNAGLYIDLDHNGIFGNTSYEFAPQKNDGTYSIANVPAGTYQLKLNLPAGVVQTVPSESIRSVTVFPQAITADIDFGVADLRGSISGVVYYDHDRDGQRDTEDEPLANQWVYLLDAGSKQLTSILTSVDGAYRFASREPAVYRLRTSINSGLEQTTPANAGDQVVTVGEREALTGVNFGAHSSPRDYTGSVFRDLDGNTFKSDAEPGLEGVTVWADLNRNGTMEAVEPLTATAADGSFHFKLDPDFGSYSFRIVLPSGYVDFPGREPAHESGNTSNAVVPLQGWGLFAIGTATPATTTFLSDLTPTYAANFYGPYEKDKSNGEQFAGDGKKLSLNGKTYTKGIGLHAAAELRYMLAGKYTRFQSEIGVDDEVGNGGSVTFKVYGDDVLLFDSGKLTGASATKLIDVDITGKQALKLIVDNAGDGATYDHADFADAKLLSGSAATSPPQISISDATGFEMDASPNDMTFVVSLDHAYTLPVAFDVASTDGTAHIANGSDRGDFLFGKQTLVLQPGETRLVVPVRVEQDPDVEPDEIFYLDISNPRNATLADSRGVGTIKSEDVPPPTISISDGSIIEGNGEDKSLKFTVSLDHAYSSQISADLTLIDGTAVAGSDYTAVTSSVSLVSGETTADIYIHIIGDTAFEPDETFTLKLSNVRNAVVVDDTAIGTIINDDADPNAAPTATTFVSDLTPTYAQNYWGPWEKDKSNGEQGRSDGKTITLNGKTYSKGLGTHAGSDLRYTLAGKYVRFQSDIGVDDEVGNGGSVVFQVYADNVKLFDSGVMTGASATQKVDVGVSGKNELRLVVSENGAQTSDHADWADAKILSSSTPATPPVNLPPTAVDDAYTGTAGEQAGIWVTYNDSDPDGSIVPSSVSVVASPAHGNIVSSSGVSPGVFVYEPNAGYVGTDTFTYTVRDNANAVSNVATVTITVAPRPAPVVRNDAAATSVNSPVTINVLNNDSGHLDNVQGLVLVDAPSHGSAMKNQDRTFTYTPQSGFVGTDVFTYRYTDRFGGESNLATVTVTVNAANTTPIYLSDLSAVSSINGYGAYEKNRSNGEAGATDGKTLTLAGKTYAKGLGTHAKSEIVFNVPAGARKFVSDIGIDDEVGNYGSVVFKVYSGTTLLFGSTKITGASATQNVNIDLTGITQLRLVVEDNGDGNTYDHGDWADAMFVF